MSTPYSYTCSGSISAVLAATPVATLKSNPTAVTGLSSVTASSSDSLRATFTLPSTSNNTTQNLSSALSIGFTATQRAGTAR